MAKRYRNSNDWRSSLTWRGFNIAWTTQAPTNATWTRQVPQGADEVVAGSTTVLGGSMGLLLTLTYAESTVSDSSLSSVWTVQTPTATTWTN